MRLVMRRHAGIGPWTILAVAVIALMNYGALWTWQGNGTDGYVCVGTPIGTAFHPQPDPPAAHAAGADFDVAGACNREARRWVLLDAALDAAILGGCAVMLCSRTRRRRRTVAIPTSNVEPGLSGADPRQGPLRSNC